MKKKYFFFDIDDTLTIRVPGEEMPRMPESAGKALDALRKNGHFVSIATGRAHWMAKDTAEALGIDNLVTDGGHGIVIGGKVIELSPLDHEKAAAICTQMDAAGYSVGISLFDDGRVFIKNDRHIRENPRFANLIDYVIDENLDFANAGDILKIFVNIPEEAEKHYPILDTLPHMRYFPEALLIEPADKFAGIRRMMEILGGPVEDVVVFGDGHNDMAMFRDAPFAIAMGNAVDELKAIADFVTKDADQDGIEYACRHFGWI